MKSLINLILLLCISAFLRETSPAQPATTQFPQINITARFIESEKSLFQTTRILPRAEFESIIAELSSQPGVDALSAPSIVTRDNQPAKIEVVREFIYPVGKSDTGEKEFETTNVGTILSIHSDIQGKKIRLAGKATVREFDDEISTPKTIDLPSTAKKSNTPVALTFHTVETVYDIVLAKDQCAILHCRRSGSRQKDLLIFLDARLITDPANARRKVVLPGK